MSYGTRARCGFLSFILIGVAATPSAWAADAPADTTSADAGNDEVAEVLVTARKRGEERVQDVPTAITAFSAETLEKMGVKDFADFAYEVPGLTFNDQGPGLKRYVLRGIQSPGQEQVAVYFDEVPAPGIQSSTGDSGSHSNLPRRAAPDTMRPVSRVSKSAADP